MTKLRVLVVDDARWFRSELATCIDVSGCGRVVAHAGDGREALAKADEFAPEVVTLDLEMPVLDGLSALAELKQRHPGTAVIVISAHTGVGAEQTLRALELGAYDFITKPSGPDGAANRESLRLRLSALLRALAAGPPLGLPSEGLERPARPGGALKIVVIGASTGGPAALAQLIPRLPATLPVPVVVVQHMPELFTRELAASLARKSAVRVVEGMHGARLAAGTVYIAPGGRQLRLALTVDGGTRIELTDDPPENFCRPAVDYLFRSVAQVYREAALGVILTGIGKDGTAGLREMKRHPVKVIGQSAESCTVYGMPREARAAGLVDLELPVEQIADEILATLR